MKFAEFKACLERFRLVVGSKKAPRLVKSAVGCKVF